MDQPPQLPRPESAHPGSPVGRVSGFVGSRLLLLGLIAKLVGFCFLVFAGFQVWLVLTKGTQGSHLVLLVVGGGLAFALLSIGGSATKTGLKYLHGQKSVARDVGGFVARRIERRRQHRAR